MGVPERYSLNSTLAEPSFLRVGVGLGRSRTTNTWGNEAMPPDGPLVFSLNDTVIQAVARLVDDAGEASPREPSHSDLETILRRADLLEGDPHQDHAVRVGKQKRIRSALNWALDND